MNIRFVMWARLLVNSYNNVLTASKYDFAARRCSSTVLFPALCVATARWVQPRLCHRSACFNHRSEVPPAYCACACIPKLSQDSPASFLCCFKTSIDCELAVEFNSDIYIIEDVDIDEYGNKKNIDALCKVKRKAHIIGELKQNKISISKFSLIPYKKRKNFIK